MMLRSGWFLTWALVDSTGEVTLEARALGGFRVRVHAEPMPERTYYFSNDSDAVSFYRHADKSIRLQRSLNKV